MIEYFMIYYFGMNMIYFNMILVGLFAIERLYIHLDKDFKEDFMTEKNNKLQEYWIGRRIDELTDVIMWVIFAPILITLHLISYFKEKYEDDE